VLGSAGGLIAKSQHDKQVREDKAQAAAARAAEQKREAAEDKAAQQAEADDAERKLRRVLIAELEKNIVKSAKKVVKTGYFDGPILSAQCTATGGGSSDDLTALTGTFDCLAVNKENGDGTLSGYGYTGTIDWQTGDLSWQLDD
jgi:hypothetical protein